MVSDKRKTPTRIGRSRGSGGGSVRLGPPGLLDGEIALSYVLWPTPAVEAASEAVAASGGLRREHSASTRARALELVDAGATWAEAARLVGVPKQTLGMWVRKRRRAVAADDQGEASKWR